MREWYGFCTSMDMTSKHIDSRKLHDLVREDAILEESEVEHLRTCEECMELVRVFVRQNLSKGPNP
jgi:hypothetical protein